MKKMLLMLMFVSFCAAVFPQNRNSLSFWAGLGTGQKVDAAVYSYNTAMLQNQVTIREYGELLGADSGGIAFGGEFAHWFTSKYGISFSALMFKCESEDAGPYNMNWTWYNNVSGSRQSENTGLTDLGTLALSLNLKYKFELSDSFSAIVDAGGTYFMNSSKGERLAGWAGAAQFDNNLYVDYIMVPMVMEIENVWGFNAGLELVMDMGRNLSLFVIGRYYMAKETTGRWIADPSISGILKGEMGNINWNTPIDASFEFLYNTSTLFVGGGIKFRF